jgi:hypothetical protein
LVPSIAFAQSCRRVIVTPVRTVVTPIVTPVVETIVTPVAVPVLIPAFQFQYSPPCATPAVPCAGAGYGAPGYGYGPPMASYGQPGYGYGPPMANYGQQPGYGYQAQPGYQQQSIGQPGQPQQDMVRALAKALLEEMGRQSQSQNGPNDGGPPAVPNNGGGFGPSTPFPTALPNQFPTGPNGQALANFAFNATVRSCAACHTGIGSKGDTIIFSQPGVLNPAAPWKTMAREVQEGRMPRRDSQWRLTPEEAQAVLAWYSEMGKSSR